MLPRASLRTSNDQSVRDLVGSERVLDKARILSGVHARDRLDEQRAFGQLSHTIVVLERASFHLPRDVRHRIANRQAGQFHVLAVRGREVIAE